jgi:aspartate/methionine/tyrosine aminotransferase
MKIPPFALERYFARYEFSARYLMSSSDCDGLAVSELLEWADDEMREMWDGLHLGYTESLGHPLLREEIAGLYDGVQAGEVITFVPEEAIYAAMNCLLEPGDHVVSVYPAYQSLYQLAESLGCEVSHWTPREDEGWRFHPDDLATLLCKPTKLVVVNFPHNPTGAMPSKADFARIVDLVAERDAYLFCDEMYRFLEQDPADRLPSAVEAYPKAVVLFGMSKTFGMAGTRVGWLATHDSELFRGLVHFKDWTTICGSAPSEILSTIALRNRERIISRHVERIGRNLRALDTFMITHPWLLEYPRPRAGSILLARLLIEEDSMRFAERTVNEAGIMIAPSAMFGYGERHIRIGLGREAFPEMLDRLHEYLKDRA